MPVAGTVLVLVVWGVVAHDSGNGWVQAVGALVAGMLVVGLVGPGFVLARVRCSVVVGPADAVAGGDAVVTVAVNGPIELRPLAPPGPAVVTGPSRTCTVTLRPARRGVVGHALVSVASAAPFGLMWWARTVVLELPRPIVVAPRVGTPERAWVSGHDEAAPSNLSGGRGEPRGVRPYQPGDRRHLVHWPATAHAGQLMVREHERPERRSVQVRGVLPADPEAADQMAERVMGTVADLLRHGVPVELVTAEPGGEVTSAVPTIEAAGRRLAFALPQREPPGQ